MRSVNVCCLFSPLLVVLEKTTADLDPASVLRVRRDPGYAREKKETTAAAAVAEYSRTTFFFTTVIVIVVVVVVKFYVPYAAGRPVLYPVGFPDFLSSGRWRERDAAGQSAVRVRPTRSPYAFWWHDHDHVVRAPDLLNDANRHAVRTDCAFTFSHTPFRHSTR